MISAKPVIDKQYWILKQGDRKIGALEADGDGYVMSVDSNQQRFKTIPMLKNSANIRFEPPAKTPKPDYYQVHGYDTGCRVYNPVWNVQMKVPLFTREPKSRSWLAAGWYTIKKHRTWQVTHNPKLILLERYPFQGPFNNKEEANEHI